MVRFTSAVLVALFAGFVPAQAQPRDDIAALRQLEETQGVVCETLECFGIQGVRRAFQSGELKTLVLRSGRECDAVTAAEPTLRCEASVKVRDLTKLVPRGTDTFIQTTCHTLGCFGTEEIGLLHDNRIQRSFTLANDGECRTLNAARVPEYSCVSQEDRRTLERDGMIILSGKSR